MTSLRQIRFKLFLQERYRDAIGKIDNYEPGIETRAKSVRRGNASMQRTLRANQLFDRLMGKGES